MAKFHAETLNLPNPKKVTLLIVPAIIVSGNSGLD
jgi:hypothetical protein